MANKVFGQDFADITAIDGNETVSVLKSGALKDLTLTNLVNKVITGASSKTTPVDADKLPLIDSAASDAFKTLSWSNLKATLKTYLDTLYPPIDGWISGTGTWSYSSADSPTFVISINADVTTQIGVGDRIKLTQTTTKYFIVTAVGAYSGGATLVTVYGGTDYTLANASITSPYYSHAKAPFGFPLSPVKWTVELTDTTSRSQTSAVSNTWYNLGSLSLNIPIGVWNVSVKAKIYEEVPAAQLGYPAVTLSTANNSESDAEFTCGAALYANTSTSTNVFTAKTLTLAAKTTYYVNMMTAVGGANINIYLLNNQSKLIIRAICAYL